MQIEVGIGLRERLSQRCEVGHAVEIWKECSPYCGRHFLPGVWKLE